jgi:hypothetical protein
MAGSKGGEAVSDIVQRYLDSQKGNCPCPFPVVSLKGQYVVPRYLLHFHDLHNLINQILVLRAENERLQSALEPFANFCEEMDALPHCAAKPDEAVIHWPLTVGAFRAARAAREEKP